ncbi:inositol-tetrakisphosphate 1-kinase [Folsomia candida]|uniref:Inositol-tetrakisphosphate 1-kinase n=1 Tax=Folsomia candida TaxID=158441 RepID=A0A226ESF8_FOLCA|nr:inositol-tetrakisphosphate 1-kinase [Folsomia candida]XP_021945924.1 inositol-tetrakisphosphate 1-kinase [Folsomia candida]OXA60542.1 Inositol-tetrakisphosphate 1-kinase [Folsomia candida]
MTSKRLGYWLSLKKSRKLSLPDIEASLRSRDVEPVKIDLEKPLADQGPFDCILHKLTDYIAQAESGDQEAEFIISNVQEYSKQHPAMLVIDSIDCLRLLINRFKTYGMIDSATEFMQGTTFVPKFVALVSNDFNTNLKLLHDAGVTFPAVCKPVVAHGENAHQMTLIFNEKGLHEIAFPCVVQSFINHNAVLYKLFTLGEKYFLIERPSIKNFHKCEEHAPIHFDGNEVSKANSINILTVQENSVEDRSIPKPHHEVLQLIVREIGKAMGLRLFGVDVVVDAVSGRYAIVDVNAFPGYDGVTDFSELLADYIKQELDNQFCQTS